MACFGENFLVPKPCYHYIVSCTEIYLFKSYILGFRLAQQKENFKERFFHLIVLIAFKTEY